MKLRQHIDWDRLTWMDHEMIFAKILTCRLKLFVQRTETKKKCEQNFIARMSKLLKMEIFFSQVLSRQCKNFKFAQTNNSKYKK